MTDPANNPDSHAGHGDPERTRVCILQPLVPHYRVPVFELLARQPGVDLEVWAGTGAPGSSLEAAQPSGTFRFVYAPQKRIGPFISQPRQIDAVTSGQFDVVILSWNARYLQIGKALRAARRLGVRTILWGHGYSKREAWLRRFNRNRFLRMADAALVYNHAAAQKLIARGHPKHKIFVALNAIDQTPIAEAQTQWRENPGALRAFQREHDLISADSEKPELVLFVSRLEPDKGVDALLSAFKTVLQRRRNARLAIIGRGPEQAKLEQLAKELGIEKNVHFTGAIYEEAALAPWFLSASIFAYPRAIGLSILHAFGYGVPVVTSDRLPSHNPEIEALKPGENGLLYRDGDIDDFAAAILRILDNPAEQQHMSAAARATVTGPNGFTIERMVKGFVDAIEFVTRPSRP